MTAPTYAALRQALYSRLSTALSVPVWSPHAPQDADGELLGPFPYVVIVQANETPWNTDTTLGAQFVVQIDGYARTTAANSAEDLILGLAAQVRGAIERYSLPVTGAKTVTIEFESTGLAWEDDGKTRRFISLYRVTLNQL